MWSPEENSYVTKELPGPSSFEEWRRAWRVYRYALLVLGAASHSHLERYFERFQDLVVSHGALGGVNLWWILALADQRMRSERMEVLRRALESERNKLVKRDRADEAELDPRKPWDAVFLRAAQDEEFWQLHVKEAALMFMANLKGRPDIADEGHHAVGLRGVQDSSGGGGGGGRKRQPANDVKKPGSGRRARQNAAKRAKKEAEGKEKIRVVVTPPVERKGGGKDRGGGKPAKGGGKNRSEQDCYRFTKDADGCPTPCPQGRRHPPHDVCGKVHPWRHVCPA